MAASAEALPDGKSAYTASVIPTGNEGGSTPLRRKNLEVDDEAVVVLGDPTRAHEVPTPLRKRLSVSTGCDDTVAEDSPRCPKMARIDDMDAGQDEWIGVEQGSQQDVSVVVELARDEVACRAEGEKSVDERDMQEDVSMCLAQDDPYIVAEACQEEPTCAVLDDALVTAADCNIQLASATGCQRHEPVEADAASVGQDEVTSTTHVDLPFISGLCQEVVCMADEGNIAGTCQNEMASSARDKKIGVVVATPCQDESESVADTPVSEAGHQDESMCAGQVNPPVAAAVSQDEPTCTAQTSGSILVLEGIAADVVAAVHPDQIDSTCSFGLPVFGEDVSLWCMNSPVEARASDGSNSLPGGGTAAATAPPCNAVTRNFSPEETVIIIDWDDTILPSTWLSNSFDETQYKAGDKVFWRHDNDLMPEGTEGTIVGCKHPAPLSVSVKFPKGTWLFDPLDLINCEELNRVADSVSELLSIAKQRGTVILVTNSQKGWIERTCQKFLPTLYPKLENVKLISARTTYETATRTLPLDWKLCAFRDEMERVFGKDAVHSAASRKNVISIGDGPDERQALLRGNASLPNCQSKSLKFLERPDIGQIRKQHALITGCFDRFIQHVGNLDLSIR